MRVLGCDPGFTGCAAVFGHPSGGVSNWPKLLGLHDFQTLGEGGGKRLDILAFQSFVQDWRPDHAYIENATAMPAIPDEHGHRRGMGAGTMARYMRCAGHIEATVVCCGITPVMVMPAQWKRRLGLTGPNKRNSIDLAIDLVPDAARWLKRKKDHNRAEAILLAVYAAMRTDMIELKAAGGDGEKIEF